MDVNTFDNSTTLPQEGVPAIETAGYLLVIVVGSMLIVLCLTAAFKLYRTSREGFKFDQVMTGVEPLRVMRLSITIVRY